MCCPLDANFRPTGQVRRLTNHKRWSAQPVWSADGRSILYVFGDDSSKAREIRTIEIGTPKSLPEHYPVNDEVSEIASGSHLVYSRQIEDTNIWRAELPRSGNPPNKAELFISSTRVDQTPKYSPDGKKHRVYLITFRLSRGVGFEGGRLESGPHNEFCRTYGRTPELVSRRAVDHFSRSS